MIVLKQFVLRVFLLTYVLAALVACKKTEDLVPVNINASTNLTARVWLFDQVSAVGGGYQLDFQRGKKDDPFRLASVRVKFNDNGTISGTDNAGNPIKNGVWELLDNGQKLTISGTNIFGIDGTSVIDKLDVASLNISNMLAVPQIGNISAKCLLIHD